MRGVDKTRVLICAPFGRDALLIEEQLVSAGLACKVCESIDEVTAGISEGAGTALIGDESLNSTTVEQLSKELAGQPQWSDFPLVILTSGGEITSGSQRRLQLLEPLGNVTLLERPLRVATLISSLRAVLRARSHQYQLGALLEERAINELAISRQNEELRKANSELEEFAYVSSHDLKEPLRMIKIYTQLMIRDMPSHDDKTTQFSTIIQSGVTRMENLLRDLLTFSRTSHAEPEQMGTADLSACLRGATAMLKAAIEESGTVVSCQQLPVVCGDEAQLTQVFQNLLSNAIKYRKKGITPLISVAAELADGKWIVKVQDNGIGFDSRYADRIFGLFKRLHHDEYPGTGLGLAICKRIVERCGGRIWAESVPGEGSVFSFSIPAIAVRSA